MQIRMKKIFLQYLQTAWYHIRQNKMYAAFCIAGIALTFVFVTFLVSFGAVMQGDYRPSVHSERIITLSNFTDNLGDHITGLEIDENYFFTAIK
jgi:hypothetical protein